MKGLTFLTATIFFLQTLQVSQLCILKNKPHEHKDDQGKGYLGCFKVDKNHKLTGYSLHYSSLTVEICMQECLNRGFLYAGLELGTKCSCGNDQNAIMAMAHSEVECSFKCSGNTSQHCGGEMRTNIYSVALCERVETGKRYPRQVMYHGCFKDGIGDKSTLKGYSRFDHQLTIDSCLEICRDKNFLYAAVQNGNHCFCGDEQQNPKNKVSIDECSIKCNGNWGQICGGRERNDLYSTGDCAEILKTGSKAAKYVGCYRHVSKLAVFQARVKTTDECIETCSSRGFLFAGMMTGTTCVCGKDQSILKEKIDDSKCDMNCVSEGWKCGGIKALSLYGVKDCDTDEKSENDRDYFYVGCFKNQETERLNLTTHKRTHDNEMTPKLCILECQQKGFIYASLEEGENCYCDNHYKPEAQRMHDSICNSPCTGAIYENCGGKAASAVYSVGVCPPAKYISKSVQFLGCYFGSVQSRPLTGHIVKKPDLSVKNCIAECLKKGFMYAALITGNTCMCGNDHIPDSDKSEEKECNINCEKENWRCGGPQRFNLYKIKDCEEVETLYNNPVYIGCYNDDWDRHLGDGNYISDGWMTHEMCFTECRSKNFMFAGLQAKRQCFCGNQQQKLEHRTKNRTECDWKCSGNDNQICGAWWKMGVYAIGTCKHRYPISEESWDNPPEREEYTDVDYKDPKPLIIGPECGQIDDQSRYSCDQCGC